MLSTVPSVVPGPWIRSLLVLGLTLHGTTALNVQYCSNTNTGSGYSQGPSIAPSWSCPQHHNADFGGVVTNQYQSNGACHDTCLQNYAFAVLQGNACWCSNDAPGDTTSTSDCGDPCPGFPSDKCGSSSGNLFGYIALNKAPSGTQGGSSSAPTSTSQSSSQSVSTTTRSSIVSSPLVNTFSSSFSPPPNSSSPTLVYVSPSSTPTALNASPGPSSSLVVTAHPAALPSSSLYLPASASAPSAKALASSLPSSTTPPFSSPHPSPTPSFGWSSSNASARPAPQSSLSVPSSTSSISPLASPLLTSASQSPSSSPKSVVVFETITTSASVSSTADVWPPHLRTLLRVQLNEHTSKHGLAVMRD